MTSNCLSCAHVQLTVLDSSFSGDCGIALHCTHNKGPTADPLIKRLVTSRGLLARCRTVAETLWFLAPADVPSPDWCPLSAERRTAARLERQAKLRSHASRRMRRLELRHLHRY